MSSSLCKCCARPYSSLAQHIRQHPLCDPNAIVVDLVKTRPPSPALSASPFMVNASIEMLQDQVARDLMELRYVHGLSEPDIEHVKEAAKRWSHDQAAVAAQKLMEKRFLRDGVNMEDLQDALRANVFEGLQTTKQEMAAAKRNVPFLEPRVVYPDGDGEPIVSFSMAGLYFRRLNSDAEFRKKVVAKSDELKRGDKFQKSPEVLADILDGTAARWHPHLHRPATSDEENDVRIPQLVQVDDLELCNALGTARGLHKQCGMQVACLSLPATERFRMENIMLPVLARASVYKKHGMARVTAGVDQTGGKHDEPSHARDMQELDEGIWGTIPDDEHGGLRWIRLKVWTLTIAADDPAKKSLTPFVESCSAHRNCNVCSFHAKGAMAGRPFSFLRAAEEAAPKCRRIDKPLTLRDEGELLGLLNRLRGSRDAKDIKAAYDDHGISKLFFALEYFPHVKLLEVPFDGLHLFPDGLLRSEGAWLFYVLIKAGLNLKKVDERVRGCRSLPPDVRIPALHQKLKNGTKYGQPRSSAVLRMTGSQVMHFALHSIDILDPLLTDEMRRSPAWASWVSLVELWSVVVQSELKAADVERIDELQVKHSTLFDQVPEYNGLKRPKHHFLTHLAHDVWRYGPPRGYWCFGFEGFNKVIKAGSERTNWKNESVGIMRYWSMRSAWDMCTSKRTVK